MASVKVVDGVLDSLKKSGNHLADDHFIGGDIFGTDLECANENRTESVEICGSYLSN